jgi:GTPase SAR1 family protein
MPPVKAEPPDPPAREKQKSKKARIAAEPGILDRVGATLGLCARNLTADEKEKLVKQFCEQSREPADAARKYLTMCDYDVSKAMSTWAKCLNAIDISSDVDDMATENEQPNGQSSSSSDVVNTMNRSSYGRIIRTVRRIPTLSQVTLPTIVVVGSESAGKSSTLERIAGLSLFPRDAKICTRMPIKLSLINAEDGSKSRVTLKFPGRPDRVVTEANAASAVGQLMSEVVPPGRGVIDEVLTIEVRKPSVPTLDLVDLPGIVAASIEGEPADMMSRTRAISERYLRDSNTIVVAVVPANITRVRDSQAMQLVQAAGKEAMTLGVLAKADLAHDPRYKQRKQLSPYWELQLRLAILIWQIRRRRPTSERVGCGEEPRHARRGGGIERAAAVVRGGAKLVRQGG